jgi:hypothetical protein
MILSAFYSAVAAVFKSIGSIEKNHARIFRIRLGFPQDGASRRFVRLTIKKLGASPSPLSSVVSLLKGNNVFLARCILVRVRGTAAGLCTAL